MKIEITLDVSKINKDKIKERKYKDKEGKEVTAKEYKISLVALREKKFVTQGADWVMFKTHFLVEKKDNKEEPDNFIGSGFTFEKNNAVREAHEGAEDINPNDIPF